MQKTESTEKDQSIVTSIGKWFLGLLKYLFRYDPDERWIVGIILLLAFVGASIYLWPILPAKFGSDEFKQGL